MHSTPNRIWLFRFTSLCALTLAVTWLVQVMDARMIAKMDSMSAVAFMEYERYRVHGHAYWSLYLAAWITGAVFFGAIELLAQVLGKIAPTKLKGQAASS